MVATKLGFWRASIISTRHFFVMKLHQIVESIVVTGKRQGQQNKEQITSVSPQLNTHSYPQPWQLKSGLKLCGCNGFILGFMINIFKKILNISNSNERTKFICLLSLFQCIICIMIQYFLKTDVIRLLFTTVSINFRSFPISDMEILKRAGLPERIMEQWGISRKRQNF